MSKKYLPIPGYSAYGVSRDGVIISFKRNKVLNQTLFNGYWIVSTYRGSKTRTLPVHRAVALAWVDNMNPEKCTVVNHLDGDKTNNDKDNLEWTDYLGNNDHALGEGLRTDNIQVLVRDFETGKVFLFDSLADGARFAGLPSDTEQNRLMPTRFGALVSGRFEFRFLDDPNPWFYEGRKTKIKPARHWVTVIEEDGSRHEFFRSKDFLKAYQLYESVGRGMKDLVAFAREKYPEKIIEHVDSFKESTYRQRRLGKASFAIPITATDGVDTLSFRSVTQCAKHFRTSRFMVLNRIENGKDFHGWTFTKSAVRLPGDG